MSTITNEFEDQYTQVIVPEQTKKQNVGVWDELDGLAEETLKEFARSAGIEIIEFGDFDDIKEVVGFLNKILKKRFKVEVPFVDENF
jgi:hypothetical protein